MKTTFVESINPTAGRVVDFFQVAQCTKKTAKNGNPFLAITLRDRTGEIKGNLWAESEAFPAGSFVKVEAYPEDYNGSTQLKLVKIRAAEEGETVKDDYVPASKRDRNEMFQGLGTYFSCVKEEPLRHALVDMACDLEAKLRDAPAASKNHQPYLGGLLEHTLKLMELSFPVCEAYPSLNRDILIASCFLHDIGKIVELCYDTHIGYTRQGKLVGHIIQGSLLFERYAGDLDPITKDHLLHIIASHHGQREWGATVLPQTREAQVFHLLDMIDSKLGLLDNILAGPVDADGFTEFNRSLGGAVWNGA